MNLNNMEDRLYFTDPIKALYMMKEFAVKFECKHSDSEMEEYDLEEEDRFYPFGDSMIEQPPTIADLVGEFINFRRIYVTKESESIFVFERQNGDIFFKPSSEG